MVSLSPVFIAFLAVLILAAQADTISSKTNRLSQGIGGTCDYKWECNGALVCRDRKCVHKGSQKRNIHLLRGNGEDCLRNKDCKNVCIKERCDSRRRTGGYCSRSDQCYGKLVCRHGKCQQKKGWGKQNGKPCRYDQECINVCLNGTCVNPRGFTQACKKNIHCKEELLCIKNECRSPDYVPTQEPVEAVSARQEPANPKPTPEFKKTTKLGKETPAPKKHVPTAKPAPTVEPRSNDVSPRSTRSGIFSTFMCIVHLDCPDKE